MSAVYFSIAHLASSDHFNETKPRICDPSVGVKRATARSSPPSAAHFANIHAAFGMWQVLKNIRMRFCPPRIPAVILVASGLPSILSHSAGIASSGISERLQIHEHFRWQAELLIDFLIRNPPEIIGAQRKRLGVKLRIVNGHRQLQVVVVDASVAFLDMCIDAVGVPGARQPRSVV